MFPKDYSSCSVENRLELGKAGYQFSKAATAIVWVRNGAKFNAGDGNGGEQKLADLR